MKAMLVYQAGIANVFQVNRFSRSPERRIVKRLLQHSFEPCVWFARGLAAAGWDIRTAHCNMAGDIANQEWSWKLGDAPFSDRLVIVSSEKPGNVEV